MCYLRFRFRFKEKIKKCSKCKLVSNKLYIVQNEQRQFVNKKLLNKFSNLDLEIQKK